MLAKRVRADMPFLFLVYVVGAVAYAPFAIAVLVLTRPQLGLIAFAFVGMAIVLQTVYFATLTAGYRAGDLSLVYPLARATGPLLAIGGALAIVMGAVVLTGDPRSLRARGAAVAVGYALATGVLIALYTLWDKTAVSLLLIPPIVYDWMTIGGQALVVTPVAWRRRAEVAEVWATRRGTVIVVGIISRLSYLLMRTALAISPVSYVAPGRESGILFGTLL